jgi:1-acyl-sn-glycerol-3-phosphate acyltransferase
MSDIPSSVAMGAPRPYRVRLLDTPAVLLRRIFSTVFWAFIVVSSLLLFPVALLVWAVTAPFDRRLRAQHQFTCFWASLYTWLNPAWRVRVAGVEHVRPGVTYVMVANHQSLLDILVLFRLFVHFKWVAKAELFRIVCIGWNMSLNRYIRLRRGDPSSIKRMMDDAERTLAEGSSLMMFPEGTRSADGHLKAFKHGAFTLALRGRVPLLPIVVEGTANALPKRGFILQGRHEIRVRVLPEIPYAAFAGEQVETLTERVHALFRRELGEPAPATPSLPQAAARD